MRFFDSTSSRNDEETMVVGEPVSTSAVAGTPLVQTSVVEIVPREIPGSSFAGGSTPWGVTNTSSKLCQQLNLDTHPPSLSVVGSPHD